MREPMVDNEGNSYEETAIKEWLRRNSTSPITRNQLLVSHLKPNRSLKDAIEAFNKSNGNGNVPNVPVIPATPATPAFIEETNPISLNMSAYNKNDTEKLVKITINPIGGTNPVPMDIVVVIDVSGSMDSLAYIEQEGKQVNVGLTLLDITKHAIKTVIESMKDGDRISIVSFSDTSTVVCNLTQIINNKTYLKTKVSNLRASGCTNIWAGLNTGLKQFESGNAIGDTSGVRVSSLLFMTDGLPSEHLQPPRGILESLKRVYSQREAVVLPTIYTFGFGYSLDTKLLVDIANVGNGSFSFIPDAGLVGTVIIHTIANISTVCGSNLKLKVTNGNIKKIYGYESVGGSGGSGSSGSSGSIISLDTIHYGQSKEVVLLVETTNDDKLDNPDSLFNLALNVSLEYKSYTNKTVKLDCYEISPINSYDSLKKPIVRLEFVELIANIIKLAPCEATNKAISDYLSTYDSEYYKNDNESVLFDLKGQVKLASSDKNYYYKWGMNYLYSLMCANRQQKCNNFKDKSVDEYGGDIFKRVRDDVDTIYSDMEPPVPSQSASYNDSSGSSGGSGGVYGVTTSYGARNSKASAPALSRVQFVNAFNNRSGGCFHEDCEVLMADKTTRPCQDIKKGDVVSSANDMTAVVVCVIKIKCENDMCRMVNINGLNITEYHPVKNPYTIEQEWVFPRDVGTADAADAASAAEDIYCEYMYNFVLDSKHMVNINNVLCVTLGHGFTENAVIAHDYYGTDKVINDLKKMKGNADSASGTGSGYEEGLITLKPNCVIRDENGKVVGIYSAACY
jgi:uncharacterized protein YegL